MTRFGSAAGLVAVMWIDQGCGDVDKILDAHPAVFKAACAVVLHRARRNADQARRDARARELNEAQAWHRTLGGMN